MPYLDVKQQQLFYAGREGGDGPALLLLHGAGGSRLNWPAALRRLPDTAVYALDLPGHGRSQKPGRDTIDAYANDVVAFIEALALDEVVIVGHSMGGAIAQTIALRHVPPVQGLVLIGTGARLRVMDAILEGILTDFEATVSLIARYLFASGAPAELVATGRQRLAETDPAVMHGDFVACNRFDVMGQLARIELPVLVVGGTADQMTPLKYAQYLAEHIPRARLVTIEGGGHMVALEQPHQVTTAIAGFLAELKNGDG